MTNLDLWLRPWALIDGAARPKTYRVLEPDAGTVVVSGFAPLLITDAPNGPLIDGKRGTSLHLGQVDITRSAWSIPFPLKTSKPTVLIVGDRRVELVWRGLPDAPSAVDMGEGAEPHPGLPLMNRVKQVWTRLREVEDVLNDPATLWDRLARLWLSGDTDSRPRMDEIVRQARELPPVLEQLDKAPRRILRRVHKPMPLSRVQELDRRSMMWLVRQPGETIAEQAGDRQRILGVAREENFNTLENRVLHAYARLARQIAADYVPTRARSALRSRERRVKDLGTRCRHLATDLTQLGVGEAQPDVTPNFVLLNNTNYHSVWEAWRRLLARERVFDDLWRWQVRSWEEFCALAVMVAVQRIPGAELVALSPLTFRAEQDRGRWLEHLNPLGVLHLTTEGIIVEVAYGYPTQLTSVGGRLPNPLLSPLRLRCGRVGNGLDFLKTVLVWPSWSETGGLIEGEAADLSGMLLPAALKARRIDDLAGGIVLRPTGPSGVAELDRSGRVSCLTMGAAGIALKDSLNQLSTVLVDHLIQGAAA